MKKWAYYNDNDKHVCEWVRELIKRGLIAPGEVDERSIKDVQPEDVKDFAQCHWFCGIGGWSYALRLAGVADDVRLWTGSCPCQPFSAAGKRKGVNDDRHLWPEMRRLISESGPAIVFGEQVASKDGRQWLARVFADLEDLGYAAAGADLCAASVGSPHVRQRIYWVADSEGGRLRQERAICGRGDERSEKEGWSARLGSGCADGGMDDSEASEWRRSGGKEHGRWRTTQTRRSSVPSFWADCGLVACRDSKVRRIESGSFPLAHGVPARMGRLRGYGNAIVPQVAAEFITAYIEARSQLDRAEAS